MSKENEEKPDSTNAPGTEEENPVVAASKEEQPKKGEDKPEPSDKPDDKKDEPSDKDEPAVAGELTYNDYDHPALKQATSILKDAKVPVEFTNEIFAAAVETGDLSKVDRAKLEEKLGKDKADTVMLMAENFLNSKFKAMQEVRTAFITDVGGEEVFNAMTKWVREKETSDKAFAKEMKSLRTMLDSENPRIVRAATKEIFELYKADPNTTITANLTKGDGRNGGSAGDALSRKDYGALITKAVSDGTYSDVREALWARRQAGIKQGI